MQHVADSAGPACREGNVPWGKDHVAVRVVTPHMLGHQLQKSGFSLTILPLMWLVTA